MVHMCNLMLKDNSFVTDQFLRLLFVRSRLSLINSSDGNVVHDTLRDRVDNQPLSVCHPFGVSNKRMPGKYRIVRLSEFLLTVLYSIHSPLPHCPHNHSLMPDIGRQVVNVRDGDFFGIKV